MSYEKIREAAAHISEATGRPSHAAAVVLGSGLSDYATSLTGSVEVPYEQIPHFPIPKIEGHAGSLFSVLVGDAAVLLLAGRVHTYEGWDMSDIVFGVRAAVMAGCGAVVLTNAAGGIGEGLVPGDLVAIRDHLNFTGRNPLVGDNDPRLGSRFPDLTDTYDPGIRQAIAASSREAGLEPKDGVYAWMLGPSYESPAEIEFLRRVGADLVGMSTVPEAIALRHMGAKVGGISLVTNFAAGVRPTPLSHEEVTESAALARDNFTGLLDALLPRLVAPS